MQASEADIKDIVERNEEASLHEDYPLEIVTDIERLEDIGWEGEEYEAGYMVSIYAHVDGGNFGSEVALPDDVNVRVAEQAIAKGVRSLKQELWMEFIAEGGK